MNTPPETMREEIARTLHEVWIGGDPDELIHAPYQNSWEEPKWRRWEQWEEAVDAILALPSILALLHSTPVAGGEGLSDVAVEGSTPGQGATREGLQDLRALSEAATPGEWYKSGHWIEADGLALAEAVDDYMESNPAFIVAAVNFVRALLSSGSEATTASPDRDPLSLPQELPQPGIDAGFKSPPREGRYDYAAVVRADLLTEISHIADDFPNHGDWGIGLPAGHWRQLAALLADRVDA